MEHLPEAAHVFFAGEDDKGVYCYYAINILADACAIHNEVLHFTPETLKRMRVDFEEIKDLARAMGCRQIMATNYGEDPKWEKYIKHFGFDNVKQISVSVQEV